MEILVPAEFQAWTRGFGALPSDAAREAEAEWGLATDLFFDRTQAAVHVITGDLKRTGRQGVRVEDDTVVGSVTYGDETVDYAVHEFARGGPHDALAVGWEAAAETFERALGTVWSNVVAGWR